MREIFYPADGLSMWRRVAAFLTLASTIFLVAGFVLWQGSEDMPTITGIALAAITVVVVATEVLIALSVRQDVEDGLRLDEAGLTSLSGGREVFWGWREVSAFRLNSRFHPAGLVAGRCISFQAPATGVGSTLLSFLIRILFWGHNTVLGDNFLVRPEDLVERLNAYREIAIGSAAMPDGAGSNSGRAPRPVVFIEIATLDKRKRLKKLGFAALGVSAIGVALVGLLFLAEHTWPETVDMFLESGLALFLALPFVMMLLHWLPMLLWAWSPASNLLLVSEGGIQYRKGAIRRHWLWDEVYDIELRETPLGVPTRRSERSISLTVAHAGDRPGKPSKDDKPTPAIVISFEEIYDAPLDQIAAAFRAWADWRQLARDGIPATPPAEFFARPIRFARQLKRPGGAIERATTFFAYLWMPCSLAWLFFLMDKIAESSLPDWVISIPTIVSPLLITAPFLLLALLQDPELNYLDLDAKGLTWRRLWFRYRWDWKDLPYFEMRVVELRWKRRPVAVILFVVQRDNRFAHYVRWAYRIGGVQPRIVIEDTYANPISEILSTLNKYRRPRRIVPEPEPESLPEVGVIERLRAAIGRISPLPMGADSR